MKKKWLSILCAMIIVCSAMGTVSAGSPHDFASSVVRGIHIPSLSSTISSKIGYSYSLGAAGPNSFDCSGLVWYVYYTQDGIPLGSTHGSAEIAQYLYGKGASCTSSSLVGYDLIFYDLSTSNDNKFLKIDHVAIYINNSNGVLAEARPSYGVVYSSYRRNQNKEVFYADPFVT